jgi:hypothetical protein
MEAEIYLYDTLPGGAGFAQRVGKAGLPIFHGALSILVDCPENCDRSCYRCLRNYRNKFEHDLLDRHIGAGLLRFVLTDIVPTLPSARVRQSTDLLFQDLERQQAEGLRLERDKLTEVKGLGQVVAPILATNQMGQTFVVGLHGPLTPDEPLDDNIRDLKEYSTALPVILVDELVVRRNLPSATAKLLEQMGCLP